MNINAATFLNYAEAIPEGQENHQLSIQVGNNGVNTIQVIENPNETTLEARRNAVDHFRMSLEETYGPSMMNFALPLYYASGETIHADGLTASRIRVAFARINQLQIDINEIREVALHVHYLIRHQNSVILHNSNNIYEIINSAYNLAAMVKNHTMLAHNRDDRLLVDECMVNLQKIGRSVRKIVMMSQQHTNPAHFSEGHAQIARISDNIQGLIRTAQKYIRLDSDESTASICSTSSNEN